MVDDDPCMGWLSMSWEERFILFAISILEKRGELPLTPTEIVAKLSADAGLRQEAMESCRRRDVDVSRRLLGATSG